MELQRYIKFICHPKWPILICFLGGITTLLSQSYTPGIKKDWLIESFIEKADISLVGKDFILQNGLVRRSIRITPNAACFDYTNLMTGQQLIRSVKPEAKITIDGHEYNIGGLHGQSEQAYLLPTWLDKMLIHENDFVLNHHESKPLTPYLPWRSTTWAPRFNPASGMELLIGF